MKRIWDALSLLALLYSLWIVLRGSWEFGAEVARYRKLKADANN